jgi:hypothetical protein
METPRLYRQNKVIKLAVSAYLCLSLLGFTAAALISHQRYQWDHVATTEFYLGNEAKMAYPKLYSELIATAHVHSFVMPIVFLILWLGLPLTPIRNSWKTFFILGGTASILIYNAAPFLVRYHSAQWVWLFTLGGVGLFFFYLIPSSLVLSETWWGLKNISN